jgi:hypothetical protein
MCKSYLVPFLALFLLVGAASSYAGISPLPDPGPIPTAEPLPDPPPDDCAVCHDPVPGPGPGPAPESCADDMGCNDGNACTTDSCDTATNMCVHTPIAGCCSVDADCDDFNACTTDSCDAGTALCSHEAIVCPQTICRTAVCNRETGLCESDPVVCPDDGNPCTDEFCDNETGACERTLKNCDDGVACTDDSCNEEAGGCENTPNDSLCDDGRFCNGVETCDPTLGDARGCEAGPPPCNEGDECNDTCNEDDHNCFTDADTLCDVVGDNDDGNNCTIAACDGFGTCDQGRLGNPMCICRAGFWGTHAGEENVKKKKRSMNVTQAVMEANAAYPNICGEEINNTSVDTAGSALEALCVAPMGMQEYQLARQLTAMALNCVMTDLGGASDSNPCASLGMSIEDLFVNCNDACASGDSTMFEMCIEEISCFNNGGVFTEDGYCRTGSCSYDGSSCNDTDAPCNAGTCDPILDNCSENPLVNDTFGLYFDPPGPAGSSKACNMAIKDACTIFGNCSM